MQIIFQRKAKNFTHLIGAQFTQSYQQFKQSNLAHNVKDFGCLKSFLSNLNSTRPQMHCILFKAAWNPLTQQADQDYEKLSNQYSGFDFYRIDLDLSPRAKQYFGVQCEPEIFVYLQGAKMTQQIGVNYEALCNKLQKVSAYSLKVETLDGTNQWEDPQAQWKNEWENLHKPFDMFTR